jgi:hypothetical protein
MEGKIKKKPPTNWRVPLQVINKGYKGRQWVANNKEQRKDFLRCYKWEAKSLRGHAGPENEGQY